MSVERMLPALIAEMFLIWIGLPASASARSRPPAPAPLLVNVAGAMQSPDGAFVISTIAQARTQLALARLAMSESGPSDTRSLALQAQELWMNVDVRLRDIAQALGIPTPAEQDARERAELDRLEHVKARDFASAYARLVARDCNAILERMNRMDPRINSHILFFVDDMLPRFTRLDMGSKNE